MEDSRSLGDARSAEDDALVRNAIRLAENHRSHCSGAGCDIALSLLVVLLQRAGIALTSSEYGSLL